MSQKIHPSDFNSSLIESLIFLIQNFLNKVFLIQRKNHGKQNNLTIRW